MTVEAVTTPEDYAARVDRSRWQRGPWDSEPDLLRFEAHGFPCLILRHPRSGYLCGYVAVPPGHPWHGVDFSMFFGEHEGPEPEAHGGITYSKKCVGVVCHIPKPGDPDDVWWLGFDAAHAWDANPREGERFDENYRTVGYMRRECESLAKQAAEVSP